MLQSASYYEREFKLVAECINERNTVNLQSPFQVLTYIKIVESSSDLSLRWWKHFSSVPSPGPSNCSAGDTQARQQVVWLIISLLLASQFEVLDQFVGRCKPSDSRNPHTWKLEFACKFSSVLGAVQIEPRHLYGPEMLPIVEGVNMVKYPAGLRFQYSIATSLQTGSGRTEYFSEGDGTSMSFNRPNWPYWSRSLQNISSW